MKIRFILPLLALLMVIGCAKTSDIDALSARLNELEQKEELSEAEIDELTSSVTQLQKDKTELETKISELEKSGSAAASEIESLKKQLEEITQKIEKTFSLFVNRIQSIVVVPTYTDGSVRLYPANSTILRFEISPVAAVKALIGMEGSKDFFSVQAVDAATKSSNFHTFDIESVEMDPCEELVEVTLAPVSDWSADLSEETGLMARLKVEALKDQAGYVCKTSTYFPLYTRTKSEDPVHTCDNLVFVPAQKPTAGVDGCIAHWHCDGCNKNYLDEAGTQELTHLPIIPAKCHSIPKEVLSKCNDFLPWREPQTKVSAGFVAGKCIGIVGKVISVCKSAQTTQTLNEIAEALTEISADLDEIQKELDEMDTKIDDILAYLEVADDKEIIKAAYDYLKPLFKTTVKYYTSFKSLSGDYQSGKIDESTYKETLLNSVLYWATKETYESITMMDITKAVMDIFEGNLSGVSEKPFTESLKNYVNYYRYWDDEGYSDRAQFLRFYETTAAMSDFLLQLYTNNCEIQKYKNNDYLRIADSTDFAQSLELFPPSISADSTNMAKAYGLYRRFHNNSIEFRLDPVVRSESIYDYLNSQINSSSCYFYEQMVEDPSKGTLTDKLINPFLKKLTGAGTTDFIKDDEVNAIYQSANVDGQSETLTQIFVDHGMNMNPHSIEKPILFTCRNDNKTEHNLIGLDNVTLVWKDYSELKGFYIYEELGYHVSPGGTASYNAYHVLYLSTACMNMYMDYCHDDNNSIIKHTTSSDDDLRTAAIKNLKWTNWTNDQRCRYCYCYIEDKYTPVKLERSMGTTPDSRARYTTTFRYYQGTEIPD